MAAIQQILVALGGVVNLYTTWSTTDKTAGVTLSGGNLTATAVGANDEVRSALGKSTGKWYWELKINSIPGSQTYGLSNTTHTMATQPGFDANSVGYISNTGGVFFNSTSVFTGATYTTNDIIGFAYDADARSLAIYKNNVLQGTVGNANMPTGTLLADWFTGNAGGVTANFGATALTYTPPTGFNAGLYQ